MARQARCSQPLVSFRAQRLPRGAQATKGGILGVPAERCVRTGKNDDVVRRIVTIVVAMARSYYVYILANRSRTLYVGVTNDIARRVAQHRVGAGSRFTRRYAVHRLVFVETTPRVRDAIAREKQIKRWSRWKRLALIEERNPTWVDLAQGWPSVPLSG